MTWWEAYNQLLQRVTPEQRAKAMSSGSWEYMKLGNAARILVDATKNNPAEARRILASNPLEEDAI